MFFLSQSFARLLEKFRGPDPSVSAFHDDERERSDEQADESFRKAIRLSDEYAAHFSSH